ncbi:hypothetical protein CSC2_28600 [Clostridium zeae]|uniref:HTH tetR-type domain-containing protein n=1 Tax=Clostridium zeae TaxID=2759022 RepID=A0ABQ1EC71_9CLOT|nr:TetR/AcrR family transcriptional regulator [Clostridium zeae]GFZ32334.1 hypothetical protein CSC2_28600 [Clostridium zeae]
MSKRSDILDATLQLIVEESIQSVTLAKILKKADVGSGTLYNYFSSKDDLISALYQDILLKMDAVILSNYDQSEGIKIRFDKLVSGLLEYTFQYFDELNFAEQYAYLLHKTKCHNDTSINNAFINIVYNLIIEGQNQRIIKNIDTSLVAQIISGIITSVVKGHKGGKLQLDEAKKHEVLNACWHSIRA